ncbi:MAG TPA: hypothetical protein VFV34_17030, partial [Blastocatellia bacterium]|nr:hypothetical protein [Blastocatellia bacterium]
ISSRLFNWSSLTAYRHIFRSILASNRTSKSRKRRFIRDVFKAWNREWLPEEVPQAVAQTGREQAAPWSHEWFREKSTEQ